MVRPNVAHRLPAKGRATWPASKESRPVQAGLYIKIAYQFTRRSIAKLIGRETERMIEPLEMYAHVPVLLKGYAKLEQATARLHRLGKRLHALAELKAATLAQCEYCIDMGSAISRRWGLTDEEILALPGYQASPLFSELDKLVLDYAVGMTRTPPASPTNCSTGSASISTTASSWS